MTYTQAKQIIMYWRGQLGMDCDNTPAAIRTIVQLTARAEAAEATGYDVAAQAALDAQNLREALTAMRQRAEAAEAAEAALAAVPVKQIRQYFDHSTALLEKDSIYGWMQAHNDCSLIREWLTQQGEAQPRGAPTAVFEADDFEVDEGEAQP